MHERDSLPGAENVQQIPTEVNIPKEVEAKDGVQAVKQQFTAQVSDGGQQLIQTPQTQAVTITIPSDQGTLTQQSKGNIVDSLTWLAAFWLRMIKKAMYFGWKITKK